MLTILDNFLIHILMGVFIHISPRLSDPTEHVEKLKSLALRKPSKTNKMCRVESKDLRAMLFRKYHLVAKQFHTSDASPTCPVRGWWYGVCIFTWRGCKDQTLERPLEILLSGWMPEALIPGTSPTSWSQYWKSHQWGFQQPKGLSWWSWEGYRVPYKLRDWWSCSKTAASADTSMYFPDAHQLVLRKDWLSLLNTCTFCWFSCCQVDSCNAWAMGRLLWQPTLRWWVTSGFFKGDLAWSVLGPGICCSRDEPCPDYSGAKKMTFDEHLAHWFLTTSKWQIALLAL